MCNAVSPKPGENLGPAMPVTPPKTGAKLSELRDAADDDSCDAKWLVILSRLGLTQKLMKAWSKADQPIFLTEAWIGRCVDEKAKAFDIGVSPEALELDA